jgi:cardiolipin synthase
MRNLGQFFYPSNQLTLLRLVFIPFVIISILYGQYRTAFILVLIAGLSDGMDGLLARRLGQQTTLGRFLDPLADKLLLNSAFVALGFAHQIIPLWLVILVLSRDVLSVTISLVMMLASDHKPPLPSFYGKANTVAQVATVLLTLFVLTVPNEILAGLQVMGIYCTAVLTIASGLQYAYQTAERLRGAELGGTTSPPKTMIESEMETSDRETRMGQNRLH